VANASLLSIEMLSALALAPSDRAAEAPWARRWRRSRERIAAAGASFWQELYRELRRHAGDERLPFDLRTRLRHAAQRAFERSQRERMPNRFPRLFLRTRAPLRIPERRARQARAALERLGFRPTQPFVTADVRGRDEAFHDSLALLESRGYAVMRLRHDSTLDAYLLLSCAFLLCDNPEAQRAAYVTNTPTLTVNATDAFTCYPVRQDGIYLLKTAIDLDSGRLFTPRDVLGESYYRNRRNIGYRDNRSDEIRDAVSEMLEGLRQGWCDSEGQARYRAAAVAAGESLASRVRHVATWGPVDGFIGDGRLARVQADRA
jgi:hypothetical protein